MMPIQDSLCLIDWKTASPIIKKLSPEFWEKMCTIDGIEKMEFLRARYPYGVDISKDANFNLFHDDQLKCWNTIPKNLTGQLNYNWRSFPAGILTKGSMEVYLNFHGLEVPRILIRPGMTFSLMSVLDFESSHFMTDDFYSATSGCKSVIMLPSITHQESSDRLASRLNIPKNHLKPSTKEGFFNLFKSISENTCSEHHWHSEMLFFPKSLIEELSKQNEFSMYIHKKLWRFTEFWRYHLLYDAIWQQFLYLAKRKLTLDLSIITAASKIILTALGQDPAYIPANNNNLGPFQEITDVFYNIYKIRYNAPISMCPGHITTDGPVYFSMHYYEVLNGFQTIKPIRKLDELKTTEKLVNYFVEYVKNKTESHVDDSSGIKNILINTSFDFYHQKMHYGDISDLWQNDTRFFQLTRQEKEHKFPGHSSFFQGCVRIKHNKSIREIYR